ncbi:rhomboid family intramembrane serine protease [Aeribacillus pallidus]|jgi:rhomboid protease GluP|uniref:rhomboid family intramembrane serine protease n=1 Tax=Aeribacillus pallidus TaxID=33936 RepID=UPI001D87908C|nr:rhomboid family intramembrane serine protease [Bacillus sp. (in: firmicutes)]
MFVRTESFSEFIKLYPVITILVAVHLLLYIITNTPFFPTQELFALLSGVNVYIADGEVWRLVTPIFLHSGFAHVLFNSFSLILFGPALERLLGKGKFLFLYLISGVLANIATFFLQPLTYIHVGSSGAIFGLFGYYISVVLLQKSWFAREVSQVVIPIVIIGSIMTFFQSGVNITAHMSGLLAGFGIGWFWNKK